MCGIAGIIYQSESGYEKDRILKMLQLLKHRGPDAEGIYEDKNVQLGHTRLSIIDLDSHANQPLVSEDQKYVLVYNGEIYNYLELKKTLLEQGYQFKTDSDSEVLLKSYQHWGRQCVNKFNGMWAFAIYDKSNKEVFCSRDRFGIKPFYYINKPGYYFAFASEIKPLLTLLRNNDANMGLVYDFILTGQASDYRHTFFENIEQLPASTNLRINLSKYDIQIEKYYSLTNSKRVKNRVSDLESIKEKIYETLSSSVKLRLQSDVTVGTCLSGGIDSSIITALANGYSQENGYSAITAVSDQENNNELKYAKLLTDQLKISMYNITPNYEQFAESLDDVVRLQEEPIGGPSIFMQYFVMKLAKQQGIKVLLDGQGGDEVFLGYPRYSANYLLNNKLKFLKVFRDFKDNSQLNVSSILKFLIGMTHEKARFKFHCKQNDYLKEIPKKSNYLKLLSKAVHSSFNLQRLEIQYTNLPALLRYEDRNSMHFSIESRLPYLDYRLVELALNVDDHFKIHRGWLKWLLRETFQPVVPETILWRKDKIGFAAPSQIWESRHSKQMFETINNSKFLSSFCNLNSLRSKLSSLDTKTIWRLFFLELWGNEFL
jgi:asparagine synthase (glutamine-hydrolysing)